MPTAHFSNQDVQKRVRQEILEVIGREGQAALADRRRMPYTDATIEEVGRLADVSECNNLS